MPGVRSRSNTANRPPNPFADEALFDFPPKPAFPQGVSAGDSTKAADTGFGNETAWETHNTEADNNGTNAEDGNSNEPAAAGDDAAPAVQPPVTKESLEAAQAANKAKAKELGWANPVPYNYELFKAKASELADVAAAQGITAPTWASQARKYQWNDDYGEIGPRNEELEKELFGDENIMKAGKHLDALVFEVKVEGPVKIHPVREFADAGLHPAMLENIKLCQYTNPTAIQAYTIPTVLLGHDIVASAQTGSGKTASYLIPILSKLMGKARKLAAPRPHPANYNRDLHRVTAYPLVVVVVPTRELAIQVYAEARRLCYRTMLRPCVVYGGGPMRIQCEELEKGCDILIGTPGRLCHILKDLSLCSFSRVKFTVVDEADEMLQPDWEEELKTIMVGSDNNTDDDHLYMMFSATFPKEARALAREWMNEEEFIRIHVGRIGSTHKNIKQQIIWVDDDKKRDAILDLLFSTKPGRTIIFVNTKHEADLLDDFLYNNGIPTTSFHSDRSQLEREDAIRSFRSGQVPVMIATGVSSRGLDIRNVNHIINYDMPSQAHGGVQEYVHRIGRTARIGNTGLATSFYNDRNEEIADDLLKLLIECKQEVPAFWAERTPSDTEIKWDDDTDSENEDDGTATEAPTGFTPDAGEGDGEGAAWEPAAEEPVNW